MEIGPARLESVQARLAQCLYLMSSSRTNQAWYLFGTTAQLITSLGLHSRRYSRTTHTRSGLIEAECRKRVFWSAYTLDKYFNIILGRPGMFRDEDVDQQLPARMNDSDLDTDQERPSSSWNQCIMDAPVYHIKYVHSFLIHQHCRSRKSKTALINVSRLSRIISGICNDMYSIHPKSLEERLEHVGQRTAELKAWKDTLPAFLEPTKVDPSILVPIFQRQSTVLTLAYAHALILANRQFLLSNFADLTRPVSSTDGRVEFHIQECIEAALVAVSTVSAFVEHGKLYRTFWFSQYVSFCAIATLYVYAIRCYHTQRTATGLMDMTGGIVVPKRSHMEYFEAAETCRRLIASKTETNSPSRRYSIILDELKRQVLAELQGQSSSFSYHATRTSFGPLGTNASNKDDSAGLRDTSRLVQDNNQPSDFRVRQPGYLGTGLSNRTSSGLTVEPASAVESSSFANIMLDSEDFGLPSDFIGWADFDSWVSNLLLFCRFHDVVRAISDILIRQWLGRVPRKMWVLRLASIRIYEVECCGPGVVVVCDA